MPFGCPIRGGGGSTGTGHHGPRNCGSPDAVPILERSKNVLAVVAGGKAPRRGGIWTTLVVQPAAVRRFLDEARPTRATPPSSPVIPETMFAVLHLFGSARLQ